MNNFKHGESYQSHKNITTQSLSTLITDWDLKPKERPSDEAAASALKSLQQDWKEIAGEIGGITYPIGFSGSKLRKLVVKVTGDGKPPWGGWTHRAKLIVFRRAFTRFRSRVNDQLSSHEVDHIEFVTR